MISCSVCGKDGHNRRTCPQGAIAAPPTSPKKAPKTVAKSAAAAAPAEDNLSVVQRLEARLEKLRKEVATLERVIPDLKSLEVAS